MEFVRFSYLHKMDKLKLIDAYLSRNLSVNLLYV